MAPAKSPAQSLTPTVLTPTIRALHLQTHRNGDDDYTTTEYVLEGDGKTWRTVSSRVITSNKSRNVTTDYVRDWWLDRVGRNGMGDFA